MPEKLPFRDMEGEDLAITVLTCEGDIKDPAFPFKLQRLVAKLQNLISDEENPIKVTKVEPWNSVRVTFNIPLEAAQRLRQLAERGDRVLRELGILSVQIEGDQVITLTLASQYSEPQEIVLRKTSDEQGDVASVSFNIPNSDPVPGPSTAEPAHKNISQFLGHIVGGATSATANAGPSTRLEKTASPKPETSLGFRSPNVIAPTSTEPIPFPPSTVITTTAALPSSSRVSPNVSLKSPSGFGPFPFASMTHAMNTKNSASPQYQPVLHVQGGNPRLSLSSASQLTNAIFSSSSSSVVATSPKVSNSPVQKVSRTIANSAFNNVVSRAVPPNAIASTSRANVALSSPLLVNLLQSENSNLQQNNKLMPPPSQASNQGPKKKRKPRKTKDKILEDGNVSSPNFSASPSPPSYQSHVGVRSPGGYDHLSVLGPSLSVPISNINISSPNSQIANIHPMAQGQPPVSTTIKPQTPNIHPQTQGLPPVSLQSQVQGQPMVSSTRPLGHQTISAFRQTQGHRAVPNIHPQAQGQPQVHTGNLPLHTHIPVGALQVARPTGNLQSYAMSAPRTIPINPTRSIYVSRDTPLVKSVEKTKEAATLKSDRTSASSTPSTSTPDSNPFPSPPSSSDGKTKHLVNPFTGQLEPMPSDDEEEEESIGSLPPFPDFEIDTSEKSQSERSLSDGGKDNNLSSDTDSGISKSITDVSQSSTDGLTADSGKDSKKMDPTSRTDSVPTASVTSSVPGEKIKLRLKLDSKSIRESKESEIKEKRAKDSNPTLNQKIDVALVSIPGVKKSTVSSTSSVPEPRVPPLHISLRGPNAAVVVSPRKDDSKSRYSSSKEDHPVGDVPSKIVPKKVRSPRASRTGEVSTIALSLSGRTLESIDKKTRGNNPKDLKKVKDDFWNQNVKMSMSGGGIVEVSDKLSTSRVSSYDTFISSTSISSPVVQRKSSNIFSLASRDSCKSEIMTLTSCSTGESVTLHSFVGSKSPLPLQVAAVSETEVANPSQTVKNEVSSNVSTIANPIERTVSEKVSNTNNEKPPGNSEKDNSFSSSKNSPLMQNNYLPHSPSAPLDSKNDVQKSSCPSDQTQLQSASSLNVVSTVPLSSHSASSHTCNTNEAASDSNVQMQVSDSTDAKKLDMPCRVMATSVDNVTSSTDSQKLQNNHQCNTHSINNNAAENVDDSVNVDKNVQSEQKTTLESENLHNEEKFVVNEVQKVVDVNKNNTANKEKCGTKSSDNVKSEISQLVTPKPPSTEDGDKFKKFSNHSDACNLSVSCLTAVPKTEINEVVSDKGMCLVEVKNPPIAQIITVDNLPIQSHVIEVPSMQNSPAVPNLLAKSGCAAEVSSLSTLVPSCGSQYLPTRNLLVVQDTGDVSMCEGRVSPMNIPLLTMPCNSDKRVKLINHVNKIMQEAPSTVKESPNVFPSKEEMKLEPVEEERKRCMLLSEVPTSTPGPPPPQTAALSLSSSKSDKLCSELNISACAKEPIELKNVESVSQRSIANDHPTNGSSTEEKLITTSTSLKSITTKPDSTVTSDIQIQLPSSSNVTSKKELNTAERISLSSSAISVNSTQSFSQKHSQSETISTSLLLSNLTSSASTISVEAGPSVENKFTPKPEVKKETTCAEPVHMVSTTANSLVTSLLSPVKYLHNEVSSQKFKLIFKGSGQRSALPGGSSPTSLVVPLNSSKVPIKLVALPGGTSALSVRSTSNPNIVEIIGPKTAQNSPSNSPHISSPVRLVVSKVSPGLACANPGNSPNLRNRVLVKSVVVTSTSPSIKLLSANNLCTTTPVSLNTGATPTSTVVQSISSAVVSNSAPVHNAKLPSEDSKAATTVENSTVQTPSCISLQEKITNGNNNLPSSNSGCTVSLIKSSSVSNASCSSSADSTTKDSCSDSLSKNMSPIPVIADSSVKLTVSPDTTSPPVTVESATESITSSNDHLKRDDFSTSGSECISSEDKSKLLENECDKKTVSKKSAADTTTELISDEVSSVTCDNGRSTKMDKTGVPSSNNSVINTETLKNDKENYSNKTTESTEISEKTTSAQSKDSETVEQTADSAITTSFKYISNDLESSDIADSSIADAQPLLPENSEKDSKLKPNPLPVNSDTNIDNCVGIGLEDPCVVENEVIIASNIEVEVSSENDETTYNQGTEHSNVLSEHSFVDSAPTVVCKDEVIETRDTDSLDTKFGVNMQKFRPLGEESVGMADSTETEDSKVVVEDSQLEISLVYSKPLKRKCSENAAELIKACMGVEDGPKRGVIVKTKASEDVTEKIENEKIEENVRMSLRIRREEPLLKKAKGTTVNSDCSTDEELTLSELVSKSRTRDKPTRGRISNRDSPVEPNHYRPNRRRSGSNESRHSEEIKTRTPRENKRESNKKDETTKKLPERTKRGTLKAQDQVVMSKVGLQRSGRIRDQEVKSNALHNNKEETNSLGAKRKTRNTSGESRYVVAKKNKGRKIDTKKTKIGR